MSWKSVGWTALVVVVIMILAAKVTFINKIVTGQNPFEKE